MKINQEQLHSGESSFTAAKEICCGLLVWLQAIPGFSEGWGFWPGARPSLTMQDDTARMLPI
jgi:hypothetical protein